MFIFLHFLGVKNARVAYLGGLSSECLEVAIEVAIKVSSPGCSHLKAHLGKNEFLSAFMGLLARPQ